MNASRQTRRQFLGNAGLLAAASTIPGVLVPPARAGESPRSILMLVQLTGGNDGLNTVVPLADDLYYRNRPTLAVRPKDVLRLNEQIGLHPSLLPLHRLYGRGRLSIIQGVGYPNSNRFHFGAMDVWHSGQTDERPETGWLGRALNGAGPEAAVAMGEEVPLALRGERFAPVLAATDQRGFTDSLRSVASMIRAGHPARVYHVSLAGFDTHADQKHRHDQLLKQLADGLGTFWADIESQGNADRVLLMTVSEFGRRLEENSSAGTDHGAASCMFLLGTKLKHGIVGRHPSLTDLDGGALKHAIDFRSVHASVLEQWLSIPAMGILGPGFPPLPLL